MQHVRYPDDETPRGIKEQERRGDAIADQAHGIAHAHATNEPSDLLPPPKKGEGGPFAILVLMLRRDGREQDGAASARDICEVKGYSPTGSLQVRNLHASLTIASHHFVAAFQSDSASLP